MSPEDKEGWGRYQQALRRVRTCITRCHREPVDLHVANLFDRLAAEEFSEADEGKLREDYRLRYYRGGLERLGTEWKDVSLGLQAFIGRMPANVFQEIFGLSREQYQQRRIEEERTRMSDLFVKPEEVGGDHLPKAPGSPSMGITAGNVADATAATAITMAPRALLDGLKDIATALTGGEDAPLPNIS